MDPRPGALPKRNIAVLISLEGLSDLIKPNPAPRPDQDMVRLVVLASWSFVSTGPTFKARVEALIQTKARRRICGCARRRLLPRGQSNRDQVRLRRCRTICDRQPDRSWYRGPLIPVPDAAQTVKEIT